MRRLFLIIVLLSFIFIGCQWTFAADITFDISVDRTRIEVGDTIQLSLMFEQTQSVPAPELPELQGFKTQYLGPSTKMSIINGKASSSIAHLYRAVAVSKGEFTIGPFSFSYQGNNYTSNSIEITVVDRGQAQNQQFLTAPNDTSAAIDEQSLGNRIFIMLSLDKSKAYLNEPIQATVKLYVDQLSVRNIQYPVLKAQGYTQEKFGQSRQYRETLAGKLYDVVEFKTMVYPTQTGKLILGPAQIKCNVIIRKADRRRSSFFDNNFFEDSFFGDFFGRVKVVPMDVKSPERSLAVLPFPEENKPADFFGAVGDFTMKVSAAPLKLKAGDPITLNMKIKGAGNLDSVKSPILVSADGFKRYSSEVQEKGNNYKVFEQVIIPRSSKVKAVPEIKFSFFDPVKEQYITRSNPPISLKVAPADEKIATIIDTAAQTIKPAATQILGRDIVYIKETEGKIRNKGQFLYNNKEFLALNIFAFLLFIGVCVFQGRKERLHRDVSYARKLRAPKVAKAKLQKARVYLQHEDAAAFYEQIFKTLQQYLGHRFNRSSAGMTAEVIDELTASEGLDKEISEILKKCFAECDMARYAVTEFDKNKMTRTLMALEKVIDYMERKKK